MEAVEQAAIPLRRPVMLHIPEHGDVFERLAQRIRLAEIPSRELFDDIIATIRTHSATAKSVRGADRFDTCHACGAWTDAALALIEIELPRWTMRRLIRDDGMWLCSLSQSPNLPIELDDMAEASHENISLAILAALLDARRISSNRTAFMPASVPTVSSPGSYRICCDNFSR
jgi:hypothetical protein